MELAEFIRDIPDWPKPGIVFKDITPLLMNPAALAMAVEQMANPFRGRNVELVVGAESRGFIFGTAVAQALSAGFVPIRKPGKLPAETKAISYELEYGTDTLEMHVDAVTAEHQVLLVDDLLATGGTMGAVLEMVRGRGAEIVGASFLIELTFLDGRKKLPGVEIHSVIRYDSE